MYGYVRPDRGELKIREYEVFRGVYCGLCHALKARYGPLLRFAVNYDLTFLAMLLSDSESVRTSLRRCPYHPLRRTACPENSDTLCDAADYSVILAYWKLRDEANDSKRLKSAGCGILAFVLRGAYQKASRAKPDFAAVTEAELLALRNLEREKCPGVDPPADRFARILRAAADEQPHADRRRILRELLYHLGRIVYILDAVDDLADDERSDAYNPLRYRFSPQDGKLTPEDERELRLSLQHSQNSIISAFELLEPTQYTGILANILYQGLPAVTEAVFSGEWRTSQRQRKERRIHL